MQKNINYKILLENFTSLSILQILNYFIPLITLPYLVRVLGPANFGLVNFATAFIAYFITIVDYGFNLSAPKQISIHRDDKEKLNEIFNAVITIKFLLTIVSFMILYLLVISVPFFNQNDSVYYLTFLLVIGNTFFPFWFFQGIEKMKYITIISSVVKVASVFFIFFLVDKQEDYLVLIGINGVTQIIIALIGILVLFTKFDIRFRIQSIKTIKQYFLSGSSLFLSSAAINLYTTTNTFILGLFSNNTIVGYFTAADKIRQAIQSLYSIISQVIYPHLSRLFNLSLQEGLHFINKIIKYVGSILLILSIIVFFTAEQIVITVLGIEYYESIIILRIISFVPLITFISNIYGIQIMINMNYERNFGRIIISAAIINLLFSFTLVPFLYAVGTSLSILLTEIFVTSSVFLFVRRKVLF